MKAAVLTSLNSDLEIFDLTIPELSKNQVLVKIKSGWSLWCSVKSKKRYKNKRRVFAVLNGT